MVGVWDRWVEWVCGLGVVTVECGVLSRSRSSGMAGEGSWKEDWRLLGELEGLQSEKAREERRGGVAGGSMWGCGSGEL